MSAVSTTAGLYVQYGCGLWAPAGWVNFDASPTVRFQRLPVIGRLLGGRVGPRFPASVRYGDVVRGLPVAPGSCEAVYCSHVLEHLALADFEVALTNTLNYLRPGGTFRFVLPDLEHLARSYLAALPGDAGASVRFMEDSYLGQRRRPRGLRGMLRGWLGNSAHLWMWDYASMSAALTKAGFTDIRRARFGDSGDPAFAAVEEVGRWGDNLGMECRRPAGG
ncbi:MAG TPA: methyltransferase domain-containing protein [Tepidisphaeraceae bacterium]|nr:methyltransferase domain-containing protein [Tepidisphaeraceae bacterium]